MLMDFTYDGKHQICLWKTYYLQWEDKWQTDAPVFTWDDLHLIPLSEPVVELPKANYFMANMPTVSNRLDITEVIPGGLTHSSISGNWSFAIDHTQWDGEESVFKSHNALEKYFDGEEFIVCLMDNPRVFYKGRVWVKDHEMGANYSSVKICYDFGVGDFEFPDDFFFRIRFLDISGEVLQEDYMKAGEMPIYYRELPSYNGQEFIEWNPQIEIVSQNQDYVASYVYLPHLHPIVFYDESDNVIGEEVYVPDWMHFVFYPQHPLIAALGPEKILLFNMFRKPSNMIFITE